jgi:hypothetical protein
MLYLDYNWDLSPSGILLDEELNIDKLGWKGGDYFKLVNVNGRARLVKVDPLIKFLEEGLTAVVNEEDDTVRFLDNKQHQVEVMRILGAKDE